MVKCMVTPITKCLHQRKSKLQILGGFGCTIFLFFQEFQGGSNGFCFQSFNPNIFLSSFRFCVAGERSSRPGGPAQGRL